jgi:hypothetical protein|tara:strand:- start:14630 stop:14803 length:174 start_codon:yes stop_codon:yes gene_type:complete
MPRTKGSKNKVVEPKESKESKPIVCGHDEVGEKKGEKVFVCGAHGEHLLCECQKLCT